MDRQQLQRQACELKTKLTGYNILANDLAAKMLLCSKEHSKHDCADCSCKMKTDRIFYLLEMSKTEKDIDTFCLDNSKDIIDILANDYLKEEGIE